jgi:ketosteroid isomerase-like protein
VIRHGDGLAVSYGVASLQASFRGQDISGDDRFTRVWRRDGKGKWKAVALHANSLPKNGPDGDG